MAAGEAERAARAWLRATASTDLSAERIVPPTAEALAAILSNDDTFSSSVALPEAGSAGDVARASASVLAQVASRADGDAVGDEGTGTASQSHDVARRAVALANAIGFLTLAALRTGVAGDRMRKDLVELGRVDNMEVLDVLVSVVDRVRARHPDLAAQVVPSRVTLLASKWRVDVVLATHEAGSLLTPVVLLDLLLSTGRTITVSLTQSALATWRHDVARALADVQHLESLAILKVRSAP